MKDGGVIFRQFLGSVEFFDTLRYLSIVLKAGDG
jgi:hypothetical protein